MRASFPFPTREGRVALPTRSALISPSPLLVGEGVRGMRDSHPVACQVCSPAVIQSGKSRRIDGNNRHIACRKLNLLTDFTGSRNDPEPACRIVTMCAARVQMRLRQQFARVSIESAERALAAQHINRTLTACQTRWSLRDICQCQIDRRQRGLP